MIAFKIIETLAPFVEAFLGIWINTEVLGEGAEKKKIAVWATVLTSVCWVMNQYKLFSLSTTVVFVIIMVLAAYRICRCRLVDSLILSICYVVVVYIIDFIVLSAFGVLWDDKQLFQSVMSEVSIYRSGLIVISKCLLMLVVYTVWTKCLKQMEVSVRKLRVSAVLGSVLVLYLVKSTISEVDIDILLSWVFFLGIIAIALYAVIQYLRYEREKSQLDLAVEHSNMQLSVYNQLIKDYQDKQIFDHDLKNQYLIIRNYIQNKEYEKAEKYLESLESANAMLLCEKRTGILAVDILIACKIREAEVDDIQVDVAAELLNTTITEQELIAILGNGLDNAIEACKKMKIAPKWIRLHIRNIQEMTMIKVENSYEQHPVQEKGQFISTKEEEQFHGLGVKSMRAIVDKYAGKMKMDYADGVFSLVISFFN